MTMACADLTCNLESSVRAILADVAACGHAGTFALETGSLEAVLRSITVHLSDHYDLALVEDNGLNPINPTDLTIQSPDKSVTVSVVEVEPYRTDWLRGKIEKLNRRAVKLGVEPIRFEIGPVFLRPVKEWSEFWQEYRERQVERCYAAVCGQAPQLEGWQFVAAIDHLEAGNVVRVLGGESLEEKYRTINNGCDHCRTNRPRKYTFVVRNVETDEELQVGKSCLKDFLGNVSPHALINYAKWVREIRVAMTDDEPYGYAQQDWRVSARSFLALVSTIVERDGRYISRREAEENDCNSTAGMAEMSYWSYILKPSKFERDHGMKVTEENYAEAGEVIEWARSLKDRENCDNFQWNCYVALSEDYLREKHMGIAAGALSSLRREKAREAERRAREAREARQRAAQGPRTHVGEVGKRGEFTVTLMKVIPIDGYYGTSYLHIFLDDAGNEVKWFASSGQLDRKVKNADGETEWVEVEVGETVTVKATVKDHGEYRGKPQTKVNRVTVVN